MALALAVALLSAGARAQFLNRAVWLGFDEEGVRRDFAQGAEYFLDRMSFVAAPPWSERGLRRFANEMSYRLGSVTSSDFTIEGHLDHAVPLDDSLLFRYHFLQGETRDTQFIRNAVGLEYALSDQTALFVQGTPVVDKEQIDVSVGAWLWRENDNALRLMVTAVDAPSEKSKTFTYEQLPFGLHVAGAFGDPQSHRVAFELAGQLPFEVRRLDRDDHFEMERYIGTAQTHLRLGSRDWLVAALETEYTDKALRPRNPASPEREGLHRVFHQTRLEWWRDGPVPWSIGVAHTYHRERGRRPNDAPRDLRTQRSEWIGIARLQLPINEQLSFEPQLFAGNVRAQFFDGIVNFDEDGFEGKIAWNARWDFSDSATLALVVSTQLDEFAFGGGGAQFTVLF